MSDDCKNMYEGLFLFPQSASANLKAAVDHVDDLLNRAGADVVSFRKWDERRLAFEIKGNKRGVYFLAYFRIEPSKLTVLERDCNLSEQLLRSMVTRADHIPMETITASEGRQQINDEIKLRSEPAAGDSQAPAASTTVAPVAEEQPAAPLDAPAS